MPTYSLPFITYLAWTSVAYRYDGFSQRKLHYRQCSKKSDDLSVIFILIEPYIDDFLSSLENSDTDLLK